MKTCPSCGTQYEDHVPQCFVDGTSLEAVQSVERHTVTPIPTATPPADGTPAPAQRIPPPASNNTGLVVLLGGAVVVLLMAGGLVGIAYFAAGRTSPPPVPVAVAPPPAPAPVPVPPPPQVVKLGVTSTPDGAAVFEGDTRLCTTPCTIDHPEHAPLPRTLVLKAPGHEDTTYVVETVDRPHHVPLTPFVAAPSPPRPRPGSPPRRAGRRGAWRHRTGSGPARCGHEARRSRPARGPPS